MSSSIVGGVKLKIFIKYFPTWEKIVKDFVNNLQNLFLDNCESIQIQFWLPKSNLIVTIKANSCDLIKYL